MPETCSPFAYKTKGGSPSQGNSPQRLWAFVKTSGVWVFVKEARAQRLEQKGANALNDVAQKGRRGEFRGEHGVFDLPVIRLGGCGLVTLNLHLPEIAFRPSERGDGMSNF